MPGVSFYSQGFASTMSVHGSAAADQHIFFDGMNIGQNLTGTGSQANGVGVNELAQTELVYDAGSQSAENALGGVRMDSIPKEGGNTFSGVVARRSDRRARCRATTSPTSCGRSSRVGTKLDYSYDTNAVFGGPIRKNKLWFLFAQRVSQTNNLDSAADRRTFPQGGQSESGGQVAPHSTVRLTWQASPRNKIVFAFYKSQGGTQRFDVGLHRDQRQHRVVHFAGSVVLAADAAAVRGAGEVDVADHRAACCSRSGSRWPCRPTSSTTSRRTARSTSSTSTRTTSVRTVASSTAPQDYFNQIWNTHRQRRRT